MEDERGKADPALDESEGRGEGDGGRDESDTSPICDAESHLAAQFRHRVEAIKQVTSASVREESNRRSRSSSPSALSDHFKVVVAERDALHRNVRTLHAACSSLKQDLESTRTENAKLKSELEKQMQSQASVGERLALLEDHVISASDEKQQLHSEVEELKHKLLRAKEHYKEHDAGRQHFLETKHAEMRAVKKELKKANEIQHETQALLLSQLQEHRSLQRSHQVVHTSMCKI